MFYYTLHPLVYIEKVKLPIQAVNHHSEETVFIHGFDELPTNTRTHSFS